MLPLREFGFWMALYVWKQCAPITGYGDWNVVVASITSMAASGRGNMQDVRQDAICCLCRLRGKPIDDSGSGQIDEMLAEISYVSQEKEASFWEIFQGKCLKALTIGAGLVFFQQVSVLAHRCWSAGFPAASDATRVSILIGLLKAVSLFLLASYYTFLKDAPAVAVVALLVYVGSYQIRLSFGPIGWLMISEIFPLRLRGRGLSIAVLVNFASNAFVTFAFSPLAALVGTGILFAGFGVIAILSLAFIFFCVPETKGLTLEEIEAKLL
ncbi:Vacuolar glucose transporter 1 [Asimina triloba]